MGDVKMVLLGDTNVARPDPDSAFAPAMNLLKDADIRFCNLETVVADAQYLHPYDRSHLPRTEEWMFESYVRAGFDVMNQANNPNTYHGHEPLMRSFQVLDAAGIIHSGAGPNLAEARKPGIIERNGTKIAFVPRTSVGTPGMEATVDTPGVAFYPVQTLYEPPARVHSNPGLLPIVHTVPDRGEHLSAVEEDIRAAREQADVVIVSWHWGLSPYQIQPNAGAGELPVMEYQQEMGHFAIDSGADMVIGHHSHPPQPIEVYQGKPILYSLANFVHDLGGFRERTLMTVLVRCLIADGKIQRLSYVPGVVRGHGPPDFARPSQAPEVVKRITAMSSPLGTRFEVGEEEVTVIL